MRQFKGATKIHEYVSNILVFVIFFAVALDFLFVTPNALSQETFEPSNDETPESPDDFTQTNIRIEKKLAGYIFSGVDKLVGKILSDKEYFVQITVDWKKPQENATNKQLNYFPNEKPNYNSLGLSDYLKQGVVEVGVKVNILSGYRPAGRRELGLLVESYLDLEDKVSVEIVEINLQRPDRSQALSQDLVRVQRTNQQLRDQLDQLRLSEVSKDQEIRTKNETITFLEKEVEGLRTKLSTPSTLTEKIEKNAVWLIIAGFLGLIIFLAVIVFSSSIRALGKNLKEKQPTTVGETPLSIERDPANRIDESSGYSRISPKNSNEGISYSLVDIQNKISALKTYLNSLSKIKLGECPKFFETLLEQESGPIQCSILFEFFTKEQSKEILKGLESQQKSQILRALQSQDMNFSNKYAMMVDLGERLQRFLLSQDIALEENAISDDLYQSIAKIENNDLVELVKEIDQNMLPRMLTYLPENIILDLISKAKTVNKEIVTKITGSLVKIPDAFGNSIQDKEILDFIRTKLESINSDSNQKIFKFIKPFIEKTEPELSDLILDSIEKYDKDLKSIVTKKLVVLDSLFNLKDEYLGQILDSLSSNQVCALMAMVTSPKQNYIMKFIEGEKLEAVSEIWATYSSQSTVQRNKDMKRVRQTVIDNIIQMKKSGNWQEMILEQPNKFQEPPRTESVNFSNSA